MPLDKSIQKVLVIGSGPIVIGQAAEFDYAGAQACRVLKDAGINVVLCNSNPATIMTDQAMADEIYLEPLTVETVKRIIKKERPDSILAGLGGQTGPVSYTHLSLSFEPESSVALGFGFRCGFLGMLHMEVIQERLEREFDLDLVTTLPSVIYHVYKTDGTMAVSYTHLEHPDPG